MHSELASVKPFLGPVLFPLLLVLVSQSEERDSEMVINGGQHLGVGGEALLMNDDALNFSVDGDFELRVLFLGFNVGDQENPLFGGNAEPLSVGRVIQPIGLKFFGFVVFVFVFFEYVGGLQFHRLFNKIPIKNLIIFANEGNNIVVGPTGHRYYRTRYTLQQSLSVLLAFIVFLEQLILQ